MSGVYIKGMEMPTDCAMLLKIFPDGRVGVPIHLNWCGTMVVNDAEAIAVPPHGRLIDADALLRVIHDAYEARDAEQNAIMDKVSMLVIAAPTIIPAEEGE